MAKLNVIMSGDMTTEALTMKLMWALAHYDNIDDIKKYIENAYFADRSCKVVCTAGGRISKHI